MNRLNRTISHVLLAGLIASVALLLVGVILTLVRPGIALSHEASLTDMARSLMALEPTGFFELGLLVLLATPIARVIALLASFARRKAWLFVSFTAIVLIALTLSVILGLPG